MSEEIRRNMALFPIGIVMKLTDLTARQIRYYEQHELIVPARTSGNQRMFSLNDVERLLEIKSLIDKGVNIAGIKQVMNPMSRESQDATVITKDTEEKRKEMTDSQIYRMLKQQLVSGSKPGQVSLLQGELSRFFKK
ncbi:MerR family transcriptional regulator [Paenibacillus phoenicis]|jgi:MerR family glutamine synthetase transcriptional repressor|uniref:MerR family transcriptional regulator, glutamine synthetase repressor n=3 Tax=Paenibacillus TaxID=44249 RepID=R9LEM7_9BACL|nr:MULTISPECIES: MerR family transcriptional regulator [Paenibacillus]EES71548.1 HTH-type transcriptional regulator GlnR [Paenibacillus sp. oral taxon 786 str. D14]EOS57185.1 MerR family transcriptional regulator, glutamine synthetase repressor [Paenibacillus barengoltzii G22]MCT2197430.1 MerR family transcriptional regulator [Paenibacillus sp. p3-SID1389]MDU0330153.1 MerR family transcriptional regulator [Paenibacillus sp. 3LSP]MEA3569678.1 MerR family transcriptional regulator [Paenibacillus